MEEVSYGGVPWNFLNDYNLGQFHLVPQSKILKSLFQQDLFSPWCGSLCGSWICENLCMCIRANNYLSEEKKMKKEKKGF